MSCCLHLKNKNTVIIFVSHILWIFICEVLEVVSLFGYFLINVQVVPSICHHYAPTTNKHSSENTSNFWQSLTILYRSVLFRHLPETASTYRILPSLTWDCQHLSNHRYLPENSCICQRMPALTRDYRHFPKFAGVLRSTVMINRSYYLCW